MTGRRLLKQVLGPWNYEDYRPNNWGNKQNNYTKRWSKRARTYLKNNLLRNCHEKD